ncbi:MAG TPA: hypothetical protein PLT09_12910 [Deltaproteobacteria bacterium]|nr:hypothetical protein [Deltaproteobacteria bacterium]HPR55535.1 hypothetical protein [Deltaproteobacteria bacterium]HXK48341.1 hypothetical protein [Deltaproteobacteria bacterium]
MNHRPPRAPGLSRHAVILAAIFILLHTEVSAGFSTTPEDRRSLDLGGSLRTYTAGIRTPDQDLLSGKDDEYGGLSQTLLRLTAGGSLGASGSYEAHIVGGMDFSTGTSSRQLSGAGISTTGITRYRVTNPAWNWVDDHDVRVFFTADRLNVKHTFSSVDLTLGRQAVNFSQAYFWNPLDVFVPFDPSAFDRDYKAGVDALRMDINLGSFSSLTVVGAPGRKLDIGYGSEGAEVRAEGFGDDLWYASALMARYRTTLSDWDISLQSGKVYGGYQAGAGCSGEAGPLGLRGEAAYFSARGESTAVIPDAGYPGGLRPVDLVEDHFSLVLGADHRFDSSLYLNIEYFFNGAADDGDLAKGVLRTAIGETLSLSEHLAGIQVSYEFHPLMTGQASWIFSLSDASSLISPTMIFSVADEADFIAGAMVSYGEGPEKQGAGESAVIEPKSEFGTYPDVVFMEFKFYF